MGIRKRKVFNINNNQKLDYKEVDFLRRFLTKQVKILPRRITGITVQQQKKLSKAIKRARILAFIGFVLSDK
jgi:small subunit ribosomal protein S18